VWLNGALFPRLGFDGGEKRPPRELLAFFAESLLVDVQRRLLVAGQGTL
jgi:hypothetical protein